MNSIIIYIGDIVRKEKKKKINKYLDWFIHMMGYSIVLITVSLIFQKTIYIDNSYYGLWGLIAVIIIFILNRVVKPTLLFLALPLTAITLGLTYPLVNMFILKLADWILMAHFDIKGIIMLLVVSIVITIMNAIMDNVIIDILLKGKKK